VEEGVLHIKLMDGPIPRVSQSEDGANGSGLDDGTESLIVINSGALCEPTEHPTSLVSVQGAISMKLVFEDPFSGDHICLGRPRNEIPSVVVQESSEFFHGPTPVWSSKSISTRPRQWGQSLGV